MDEDLNQLSREELIARLSALQAQGATPSDPGREADDSGPSQSDLRKAVAGHFAKLRLGADAVTLLSNYLQTLRNDKLHMALGDLDVWQATAAREQRLLLPEIYTELWTTYTFGEPSIRFVDESEGARSAFRAELTPFSASGFASVCPKAVILGDPGSGKSTFVNFLTLCLAGELLDDQAINLTMLPDWSNPPALEPPRPSPRLLPVFLTLREFAGSGKSIWAFLENRIDEEHGSNTAVAIERVFLEQGGLLVLDGLDEVPDAQSARDGVVKSVHEFSRRFPNVRVLVTSRPYAYVHDGWSLEGFTSTTLAPFDEDQRGAFLKRWFHHAAPKKGVLASEIEPRRSTLLGEIETQRHLRELAEVPLLLTLICLLDLHTNGAVPQNREELYDRSVELLLEIWQKPKFSLASPTLQGYLGVTREELQRCIESVAFRFHDEQGHRPGLADIPEGDVLAALRNLAVAKKRDGADTDKLADYVENRAGLLNHHGSVYRFPHRTFQEYLAARHLSDLPDDEIVRLLREDPGVKWREPFLLAGAKIRKSRVPAAWDLICRVLDSLPADPAKFQEIDWRLTGLLCRLVYELRLHDSTIERNSAQEGHFQKILTLTVALIENPAQPLAVKERMTAAWALGRVGDPRPGVGCRLTDGVLLPDIVWVPIKAGAFLIGKEKIGAKIPVDFAISRYLVTNLQFDAFIEAGGYAEQRWWHGEDWDGRSFLQENPGPQVKSYPEPTCPRGLVSWYEAKAFCRWLSATLGKTIDLPTNLQWERAARGTNGRVYPWGDEEDGIERRCNMAESDTNGPSPVGLFSSGTALENGFRIDDLSGNVFEWTLKSNDGDFRSLRGGAFHFSSQDVRASFRLRLHPIYRASSFGFRVVSSPFENAST